MKRFFVMVCLSAFLLSGCQDKISEEPLNITTETNADKLDKSDWWHEGHTPSGITRTIREGCITNTEQKDKYVASLDFGAEDAHFLQKIAVAETGGDDAECMAAVMMVVLNRTWSHDFPMNIEMVINQYGQFASVLSGGYEYAEPNEESAMAIHMITYEHWDEINGALYFDSYGNNIWSEDLELTAEFGEMRFYR